MSISILPDPIFIANSDGSSIYFIVFECHWNFSTIELKSNKIFKQNKKIGSNINENCIGFFLFASIACLPFSEIYVVPSSFFSRGVNTRRVKKKSMKIINMNMRAKSILHNNFSILLISTTIRKFLLFKIQALHYFLQNQTA